MRNTPVGRISLLIADDHAVVAEGLALVLRPYFDVVGIVQELAGVEPTVLAVRPQVVLLDITFGKESAIPVLRTLRQELGVESRFVMLTAHDSPALAHASFDAGAHGFILKGSAGQDLRLAIEAAAAGRRYAPEHLAVPEVAPVVERRRKIQVGGVTLTRRQLDVLTLIRAGVERREIAQRLGLTVKGIEYNVATVKELTGIPRLLDLIRWLDEHANDDLPPSSRG